MPWGRPSVLPTTLQRMGPCWLCLWVAVPPLHLPQALAPGCCWQTEHEARPAFLLCACKTLLPSAAAPLGAEASTGQEKGNQKRGSTAPSRTPRPREQMQAGDQSLSLSSDLVGSANWVKPRKKPWVFCADPTRPPESATFPKRSSNPCHGAPRRGAAASEATTECETDLSWQLWPVSAPAVGMATICSVWGEISLEQRLLLPKNKKVGSHSILERKWNLESDRAL